MPNWCYNDLSIRGNHQTLERIQKDCLSTVEDENGAKVQKFDFERILPLPKGLKDVTFDNLMADRLRYYCLKAGLKYPDEAGENVYLRPKNLKLFHGQHLFTISEYESSLDFQFGKQHFQEGKRIYENFTKYHVAGFHDWRCLHWHTKWNARDCKCNNGFQHLSDGQISIVFTTPWNPPDLVILALSKAFPTATFQLACSYDDEDDDDIWTYQKGSTLSHVKKPPSYRPEKDEADD